MMEAASEALLGLTVGDALKLPELAQGEPEVVAGESGLDQPLRWVHSGEVRHMARLLKGGELLLITGLGLGGPAEQRQFVSELAGRRIAALVVELGTRFRKAPPALVDEATRRGLTLVLLHREVVFVEVTEQLHRELLDRQHTLLRRGDQLHRRFTQLMLAGAGIPEVLEQLARTVRNPVVLENARHELVYHSPDRSADATVLAAWSTYARAGRRSASVIAQPVPGAGGKTWGMLVVLPLEGQPDAWTRVAAERAVGLISLALLRERAEDATRNRELGNFLTALIEQDVDPNTAPRRAAAIGFGPHQAPLLPAIVALPAGVALPQGGEGESPLHVVWRDVAREFEARRLAVIAGTHREDRAMLIVLGLRADGARRELADLLAAEVRRSALRHLGTEEACLICVGPASANWAAAGAGLALAAETIPAVASLPHQPWHDVTRPEVDVLLWGWRDHPELRRFVDARLAPLRDHDRRHRSQLIATLAAFCEHAGRKTDTARALHIERQSLYHRLARIEKLLEVDLADGETLLALFLALRAERHHTTDAI